MRVFFVAKQNVIPKFTNSYSNIVILCFGLHLIKENFRKCCKSDLFPTVRYILNRTMYPQYRKSYFAAEIVFNDVRTKGKYLLSEFILQQLTTLSAYMSFDLNFLEEMTANFYVL